MRLLQRVLAVFLTILSAGRASGAPPEVRGTWLTTTANDAIASPEKTASTMKRLRELGFNVVYIECWKNGGTEWPSETMDKLVGVKLRINAAPPELQRDLLQECVIEAHRNGLLAVAWMEYGFMAAHKDTHNELRKYADTNGWLARTADFEQVGKQNPFVWMDATKDGPQQLLIDLAGEIVRGYDVDGVQLDDRIAMPAEMGRDHAAIAAAISKYAGRFAAETRRAAGRPVLVSVSPAPFPWSLEHYHCDWPAWAKFAGESRWDEYIPQNYRMDAAATIKNIGEQIPLVDRSRLIAGVRLVGDGPDLPPGDATKVAAYVREQKLGGIVWWFSRGVLDTRAKEIAAIYREPAAHPSGGRPRAIVCRRDGGQWLAPVQPAGQKLVFITKKVGRWSYARRITTTGGETMLMNDGYDAVELLQDRMPQ